MEIIVDGLRSHESIVECNVYFLRFCQNVNCDVQNCGLIVMAFDRKCLVESFSLLTMTAEATDEKSVKATFSRYCFMSIIINISSKAIIICQFLFFSVVGSIVLPRFLFFLHHRREIIAVIKISKP